MRVIGAIVAHYGADYIGYAVRSIYDHVDELWISASQLPWAHHSTPIPNPDSIARLREAAYQFGDPHNKIHFRVDGYWENEGQHRDMMTALGKERGADLLLRTDADEIWDGEALSQYLEYAHKEKARDYLLKFAHLWRSFDWCCSDGSDPVRIIKYGDFVSVTRAMPLMKEPVFHFGYARKPEDIYYKMLVHAHGAEWDPNWFNGTFMRWPEVNKNLHPTCRNPKPDGSNWWDALSFDKTRLPGFMKDHPYYSMKIIA